MNFARLALAALGGTVAYFIYGFAMFFLAPGLIKESHKYPAVFRSKEEINKVMPVGMVGIFVSILVAAALFAMIHPAGAGIPEGAQFGVLVGVFVVCGFVLHNYVNLQIGVKLAAGQAVAYFLQWVIVGIAIAWIYKPLATH